MPEDDSVMSMASRAFKELARILRAVNQGSRQRDRLYALSRTRVHVIDPHNNARRVHMAPRAVRRERIKELRKNAKRRSPTLNRHQLREQFPFRPVIGYVGCNTQS